MQTGTLTVVVTVTMRGGQLAHEAGVWRGAGEGEGLSVATGMTDSEVMVSQGVLLLEGATAEGEGTTTGVVAGVGAVVGATPSGVSVLVATGITLSEVMVSQGVDEGELGTGATLEGASELVATGITLSEVMVSQGVLLAGVLVGTTGATGVTVACDDEARREDCTDWTERTD